MLTISNHSDKKRKDRHSDGGRSDSEPQIPDVDPAELEDDQADSGPDRDHKDSGS